jgi:sigma-E factor negative regulatory protein RseB
LSENYAIKDGGIERVAGFNTQVLWLLPTDSSRYTRKIWAHADSGLLLKAIVLGDNNQVVEQYAFTELKLGDQVDRAWIDAGSSMGLHEASQAVEASPPIPQINSGWSVDSLPKGFAKTLEVARLLPGKHAPVTQLVYSDGLSAISIFVEANDSDMDDSPGLTHRGSVHICRKVAGKYLLTVVGEVPARTAMQVLDSIRYNGKL